MRAKQWLDRQLSRLLIVLMTMLVINVLWQVASRYLLNQPSVFTDEVARYLLIWLTLLGAAWITGQREHLAIDLLSASLSSRHQMLLEKGILVAIALFAFLVMVVGGTRLVWITLVLGQISAALQIPLGYVYLALPLSGVIIVCYCLINMVMVQERRI